MREIQYNVDMAKQNYEYKACMQNDDLKITLNVYNNASKYDLAGAKAILNFAKPDGTPIVKKDDITVEENIITCALDKSYTDVNGKANIEFEVTKNGTITTFPVELVIIQKVFQSEKVNNKIIEVLETIQMDEYVDTFMDSVKANVKELSSQIDEIENNGVKVETVQNTVKELAEEGKIQAYTIADKSIDASTKIINKSITQELISDEVKLGVQIDDKNSSNVTTYSSEKINKENTVLNTGLHDHFWEALESIDSSKYKTPCKISFIADGSIQEYTYSEPDTNNFANPYYWHYGSSNTIKEVYGLATDIYKDSSDGYYYSPFIFPKGLKPNTKIYFRNKIVRIRGLRCYDVNGVVNQKADIYNSSGQSYFTSYYDMTTKIEVCQNNIGSTYLEPVYAYYIETGKEFNPLGYNICDESKLYSIRSLMPVPADNEIGYVYGHGYKNGVVLTSTQHSASCGFQEVKENTTYFYNCRYASTLNATTDVVACFDVDYKLIDFVIKQKNYDNSYYFTTPQNCKYVYLIAFSSNNYTLWENGTKLIPMLCEYRYAKQMLDEKNVNKITKPQIFSDNYEDFSDKTVWVFGDSWSARAGQPNYQINTNKTGGLDWTTILYQYCSFKELDVFANGGATLTDTAKELNATTNNTFISQLNTAITGYNAGVYSYPDIVLIMGYVNDINASPARYMTNEEIGNADYDEYMNNIFFTKNDEDTYGKTYLVNIEDVPVNKIAGALRYIVEKIGDIAVDNIDNLSMPYFICFDGGQMANVTPNAQAKCRRDYKWMAERLNIPYIPINSVNAPMLWDIRTKDDKGTLIPHHYWYADGTHPFTNEAITIGQERYAKVIYREFVKLFNKIK